MCDHSAALIVTAGWLPSCFDTYASQPPILSRRFQRLPSLICCPSCVAMMCRAIHGPYRGYIPPLLITSHHTTPIQCKPLGHKGSGSTARVSGSFRNTVERLDTAGVTGFGVVEALTPQRSGATSASVSRSEEFPVLLSDRGHSTLPNSAGHGFGLTASWLRRGGSLCDRVLLGESGCSRKKGHCCRGFGMKLRHGKE